MKSMKGKGLIAGMLASMVILGACSGADKPKKMTVDEEDEFLTGFVESAVDAEDTEKTAETLEKKLPELSKDGFSYALDAYIYSLHQKGFELNEKFSVHNDELLEKDLAHISDEWKKDSFIEGTSEELGKILEEIRKEPYGIVRQGDAYVIEPDYRQIIEEFGDGMTDAMKDYLTFTADELKKPYYDEKTDMYDMDEILDRMAQLDELKIKHEDSPFATSIQQSFAYYSKLYFGLNSNVLYKDGVLREEAREHYKKTAKAGDHVVANDVRGYLEVLEKSEFKENAPDVLAYLSDIGMLSTENADTGIDIPVAEAEEETEGGE